MIELSTESVLVNPMTDQRMIFLKTRDRGRYLVLPLTHPEADAIALHLHGRVSHPPLTYDLMKSLIDEIDAKVVRVVISDFINDIFSAQIVLNVASKEKTIDARASDALAIALRTKAPVFVVEQVLEQKGIRSER